MVYYQDDELVIRNLEKEDIGPIVAGEIAQGWHATPAKYEMRLRDQAAGKCAALAAVYRGSPVGYVNVYFGTDLGPFAGKGWPEIVDFGVLEICRRRGIGARLMDVAEEIAGERSDIVCIGVGLHAGYGSAQRMYVKRGYVPDGSGVWYKDAVCPPYSPCENSDDLILHLTKKLR